MSRLEREAAIGASLPRELGYPTVVGFGGNESYGMSWMLTERLGGINLGIEAWPTMSSSERRGAIASCANRLRKLHEWEVPSFLVRRLDAYDQVARTASGIAESFINPVPVRWTESLIAECEKSTISAELCERVRHRLAVLSSHDPFIGTGRRVLVHGDLSPENVLWRGSDDLSLLDFEWSRLGAPDMDLLSFADVHGTDPAEVSRWIYGSYPELFEYDALLERLWLYQLVIAVRQVVAWSASRDNVQRLRVATAEPPAFVRQLVEGAT